MPYQILEHTADTGIEAVNATLPGLVVDLATGMFALMAHPVRPADGREVEVEVSASNPEDLVVDVLSELLYQSEVEDVVLAGFEVEEIGALHLRVKARGLPWGETEAAGPPIKAVTYHQVVVAEGEDGWRGRVYFDV